MQMSPISQSGITAIHRGFDKLDQAAQTIAQSGTSADEVGASENQPADITKALVSAKEAELETQAGAKIVGVHDELLGTIIDIQA